MESLDNFVRKKGAESLLRKIEEVAENENEQHKFAREEEVEVEDWFEFLWNLDEAVGRNSMPIVDFNYIAVERVAKEHTENNAPVTKDELVNTVADKVESATSEDVESWLFTMTEIEMTQNTSSSDQITKVGLSFDESVY